MGLADFFWLDDVEFAQRIRDLEDDELMFDDKHNVRKRKGGKLGAWVGTAQAPVTLGTSFIGVGIAAWNRAVAKRRLALIHAELIRRGLPLHAENWKDDAFATFAVGAGAAVGMGFVPGCEFAAQEFAEAGAVNASTYLTGLAVGEVSQNVGSLTLENASAKYTDLDTYHRKSPTKKA